MAALLIWLDEPSIIVNGITLGGTRKVAAVSMFTALAIATDYAMLPLANVKLMDSIVFVSALAFGVSVGASVAALTWLVYGTVNPLGPDSGPFLLLLIAIRDGLRRLRLPRPADARTQTSPSRLGASSGVRSV